MHRRQGRRDFDGGAGASSITTWALVPLKPNALTPAARGRSPIAHGVPMRRNLNRQPRPRHVRVRRREVQVRRDVLVLQRQYQLDQPGDAGRGLEVSDVGLHRAEQQGPIGRPLFGEDGAERLHLDRIAQRRAGAVRFDVVDIGGAQAGPRQRIAHHRFLRRAVRRGQAAARPVLVDRRSPDHRQNLIAVGDRIREPLQHDHAAAFAFDEAVGGRVEVLQRPSGASIRVRENATLFSGDRIRCTPPASARRHSSARRLWQAR